MADYQNHVIDPTFFDSAILEFAFDYDWYAENGMIVDELGRRIPSFSKQTINGSLQPKVSSLRQSLTGNTTSLKYSFYCKSLYRIDIGDFIHYKNRWLHVDALYDIDEWGVRSVDLTMVDLNNYKDFKDYLRYLDGEKII